MEKSIRKRIFILGDSRTGTHALYSFLSRAGVSAVHYCVENIGIKSPVHLDHENNWKIFKSYIDTQSFEAYSDTPVRSFYRELHDAFPDAYFILTKRSSTDRWEKSMREFFPQFGMKLDFEDLRRSHDQVNDDIRRIYVDRNYIEVCIDDDMDANSDKICDFLGLSSIKMLKSNATKSFDLSIPSLRVEALALDPAHAVEELEAMCGDKKGFISERNWIFLANDTNDFLNFQFGHRSWNEDERCAAKAVLEERKKNLNARGIKYLKFIIPEKSVIYPDYLPRSLLGLPVSATRPAKMLSDDGVAYYLDEYMLDCRSYGNIYFRGDSHTNWQGAFFVYRYISERINEVFFDRGGIVPLNFCELRPSVAAYNGDLYEQLIPQHEIVRGVWDFAKAKAGFEVVIKLDLEPGTARAFRVDVPEEYTKAFSSRETIVYENPDESCKLPVAVVFRDSTLDFAHEWLAQHFRRCTFVWFQGQVVDDVIEREMPDVVIHCMAERFVSKYPAWKPFVKI